MRRHPDESQPLLQSDSFLDVIANIVGILIILVVIAGLRVSRAPVRLVSSAEAASVAAADSKHSERQQEASELRAEMALLEQRLEEATDTRRLFAERSTVLKQQLSESQRLLSQRQADLKSRQEHVDALQRQTEDAQATLLTDERQLVQLQQDAAPRRIEHRLTPISHTVRGRELHFRLAGDRVAIVPLDALIGRLKRQVDRQRAWLTKFRRHQGVVGPIGGFTMRYVVEREPLTVLDELQYGGGSMRIGVSNWRIEPEAVQPDETLEEALRPGGAFLAAIRSAETDSTLTFWVYPDSFGLFRRLQAFAHREGFTVAGRPLPFGVPIAGSPDGSRSTGQ